MKEETSMDNLQNQNSPLQGFEALESFISSFLLCDDHQLTILALWVANTWCFPPPHHSLSRHPQSGGSIAQGLSLARFQEAWERYAGPVAISRDHENSIA